MQAQLQVQFALFRLDLGCIWNSTVICVCLPLAFCSRIARRCLLPRRSAHCCKLLKCSSLPCVAMHCGKLLHAAPCCYGAGDWGWGRGNVVSLLVLLRRPRPLVRHGGILLSAVQVSSGATWSTQCRSAFWPVSGPRWYWAISWARCLTPSQSQTARTRVSTAPPAAAPWTTRPYIICTCRRDLQKEKRCPSAAPLPWAPALYTPEPPNGRRWRAACDACLVRCPQMQQRGPSLCSAPLESHG